MSIRMQVFRLRNGRNQCTFTPLQSKALKCWPIRGCHMDSPGSMTLDESYAATSASHGSMGPLCQLNRQEMCHARRRGTRAHMEASQTKHKPEGRPGASADPRIGRTDLGSVDLPPPRVARSLVLGCIPGCFGALGASEQATSLSINRRGGAPFHTHHQALKFHFSLV